MEATARVPRLPPTRQSHDLSPDLVRTASALSIKPAQGTTIVDAHDERHPSAILRYTQHAHDIRLETRHVEPCEVATLLSAVDRHDWGDAIFLAPNAYSVLLRAYLDQTIDSDQFLNTQHLLEVYSQFGVRKDDLPEDAQLPAKVTRIDLNNLRYKDKREELLTAILYRKTNNGIDELFCKALDSLKRSNTPAWVDFIALDQQLLSRFTCSDYYLKTPEDQHKERNLGGQVCNWMRALERSSTLAITQVELEEQDYLMIPTRNINRCMQQLSNMEPVDLYPFYGTETADQLSLQRQQNIHPRACFHPSAKDSLLRPHNLYIGALEGIHDEHHGHLLSRIPMSTRALLLNMDQKEKALSQMIANITLQPGETILQYLPEEFITKVQSTSCPLNSDSPLRKGQPDNDRSLDDIKESLECFADDRPFLDQECAGSPMYANQLRDETLAKYIVSWIMDVKFSHVTDQQYKIFKHHFKHCHFLRWHWILYQCRYNDPDQLARLRDIVGELTRMLQISEGSQSHWTAYRKSRYINASSIAGLMGDIANEYACDLRQ